MRKRTKAPESYTQRKYRDLVDAKELHHYSVCVQQTDLHVSSDRDMFSRVRDLILSYRFQLEEYSRLNTQFLSSLKPLDEIGGEPKIVREMFAAARCAGVGPMAAVAGAISEYVGRTLLEEGVKELVVENGGDVFLQRSTDTTAAIFAGESPLSCRVGVKIPVEKMPLGVCTSSGTIGHSLSFGDADSVTVVADSALVADAVATRLGNEALSVDNDQQKIEAVLGAGRGFDDVYGIVVICNETLGAFGDIELVKI